MCRNQIEFGWNICLYFGLSNIRLFSSWSDGTTYVLLIPLSLNGGQVHCIYKLKWNCHFKYKLKLSLNNRFSLPRRSTQPHIQYETSKLTLSGQTNNFSFNFLLSFPPAICVQLPHIWLVVRKFKSCLFLIKCFQIV